MTDSTKHSEPGSPESPTAFFEANRYRFSGFADTYDSHRPRPPAVLAEILLKLAGRDRPRLVVDLGSGTGLSTRYWAGRADRVIGIEPNGDMRRRAEAMPSSAGPVEYREGFSHQTGLPDESVDIVTCSQSLHWMEPTSTFAEVARILRPGGVFAAYDSDWPPVLGWELEAAFHQMMERVEAIGVERNLFSGLRDWPKSEHLARIRASGRFCYVREITAHSQEEGNADRLVGLVLSQGSMATILKGGVSEHEIGLDEFRRMSQERLGDTPVSWYWSYRIRVGIR